MQILSLNTFKGKAIGSLSKYPQAANFGLWQPVNIQIKIKI